MAVCLGHDNPAHPDVRAAMKTVGDAARAHGKSGVTFVPNLDSVPEIRGLGISMFFVGSEHTFMLGAARAVASGFRG